MLSGNRRRHLSRLLPVPFAAYESRYLFGSVTHGLSAVSGLVSRSHPGGLTAVAVLALGAAVLLREMGRGSRARTPRPRWSAEFLGLWLLCAAALMVCFSCEELGSGFDLGRGFATTGGHLGLLQTVSGGGWSSLASALFVGFLVATSLKCARWALRAMAGWLRGLVAAAADPSPSIVRQASSPPLRLASLADGWSSRGPPLRAAVVASVG